MKQQMANITQEQEGVESFNAWIEDLEESKQPEACNIDDPNCENCGSWKAKNQYCNSLA